MPLFYLNPVFIYFSLRTVPKPTRDWKISRLIYDLILAKSLTLVNFPAVVKLLATLRIVPSIKTEHTLMR